MAISKPNSIDIGSLVEPREPLEVVLLFTRTGTPLGAWTRNSVPLEVVTVMAATLLGSIETLTRTLGTTGSEEATLLIDGRRILAVKVNSQAALLLVASRGMSEAALRATAQRILGKLPPMQYGLPQEPGTEGVRKAP